MLLENSRDLLRPSDIARKMELSPQRIRQLIANGTIPHVRIGRSLYIPAKAWMGWLEAQETQALAAVGDQS